MRRKRHRFQYSFLIFSVSMFREFVTGKGDGFVFLVWLMEEQEISCPCLQCHVRFLVLGFRLRHHEAQEYDFVLIHSRLCGSGFQKESFLWVRRRIGYLHR